MFYSHSLTILFCSRTRNSIRFNLMQPYSLILISSLKLFTWTRLMDRKMSLPWKLESDSFMTAQDNSLFIVTTPAFSKPGTVYSPRNWIKKDSMKCSNLSENWERATLQQSTRWKEPLTDVGLQSKLFRRSMLSMLRMENRVSLTN